MRGVEQADIAVGGRAGKVKARLLRIRPGIKIPRHTHAGTEMTLVLAGGFTEAPATICAAISASAMGRSTIAQSPTKMESASA